tara:strand:- start:47341 stop:48108 length:768 start_codon:yes stop_codon:yes gene_type:complete
MKKQCLLLICAISFAFLGNSQDLTSKKGESMLPEAGDYALGFDAAPFLNYVGNLMNSGANTSPTADFMSGYDASITGKYFKDAQNAYRGSVRIGLGSTTETDAAGNEMKASYNAVSLGAGIEKRRGTTRVQGFYGAQAGVSLGGSSMSNDYDEALSATNPGDPMMPRVTEVDGGSSFGIGLGAFAGVELFIFPKTSIGFEYGWGLGFNSTGAGEATTEIWDGNEAISTTIETGSSSSFGIDTNNGGGALNVIFHF